MIWKRYIFKLVVLLMLLLCSRDGMSQEERRPPLLPDHVKLQYAGNIGMVAGGVGFENHKRRWEGDFFYGYVPASAGGVTVHTLTSKIAWHAVKRMQKKQMGVRPLAVGLLVSYTPGKQYFGFRPDNYPYDYYKFPTSVHLGLSVGGQLERVSKSSRSWGLYYEVVTMDTELLSYVNNRQALKISDIISLGVGIKYLFGR